MFTDHDKISLITSIYQSGSNVSQFLKDLELLSNVLDGPKTVEVGVDKTVTIPQVPVSDIEQKTNLIVNSWKTLISATDAEVTNPTLLKFQEDFLKENVYVQNETPKHKFYLSARTVGITSAFALHAARSLIQQPNLKIWYVAESNDGIDSFCNGVFALLPKDLIENKNDKTLKLTNGSYINFITQPSLVNSFKETEGTIQQRVFQYISKWSTPDILIVDDAEAISFNFVSLTLGLIKHCPNVLVAGGVSDSQGLPYCVMADDKFLWMEKKILPWYEGTSSDQHFIKSCLTEDQYLGSQLCQFPRKPKEVLVKSNLTEAYNELINSLFEPVMDLNNQPDMSLRPGINLPDHISMKLLSFKRQYLTPWVGNLKSSEITAIDGVKITEEFDEHTGRKIFKIETADIQLAQVESALDQVKKKLQ